MNRITNAIDKLNRVIPERIAQGLTTQKKVDELHEALDMSLEEYCKFQEIKSAYSGSLLTLDEAQTVYGFLGNSVEHFNAQSITVKSVLTQLFSELIKAQMTAPRNL